MGERHSIPGHNTLNPKTHVSILPVSPEVPTDHLVGEAVRDAPSPKLRPELPPHACRPYELYLLLLLVVVVILPLAGAAVDRAFERRVPSPPPLLIARRPTLRAPLQRFLVGDMKKALVPLVVVVLPLLLLGLLV